MQRNRGENRMFCLIYTKTSKTKIVKYKNCFDRKVSQDTFIYYQTQFQ